MKKNCYILLNGTPPSKKLLASLNLDEYLFICADGAFNNLTEKERRTVDILVGDFDSLDLNATIIPKSVKVVKYSAEKDYTDGYLAIEEAKKQNADNIIILGASGGRIDHEYNNYSLLALAQGMNMQAKILNEDFEVYLIDKEFNIKTFVGATISLVPFGDMTHILCTNGLKYPATALKMSKTVKDAKGSVMGISNIAKAADVSIVLEGNALVFIQREGVDL